MNSSRVMLIGSSGAGSGSWSKPKKSAISRSARKPERMHRPGCGRERDVEHRRAGARPRRARVPAAVIHERCGFGDRKNAQRAERRVRLRQLGEPVHPLVPHRVELVEEAGAVRELEHAPRGRRRARAHRELR